MSRLRKNVNPRSKCEETVNENNYIETMSKIITLKLSRKSLSVNVASTHHKNNLKLLHTMTLYHHC